AHVRFALSDCSGHGKRRAWIVTRLVRGALAHRNGLMAKLFEKTCKMLADFRGTVISANGKFHGLLLLESVHQFLTNRTCSATIHRSTLAYGVGDITLGIEQKSFARSMRGIRKNRRLVA